MIEALTSESSSLPSVARLANGEAVCSRLIRGVRAHEEVSLNGIGHSLRHSRLRNRCVGGELQWGSDAVVANIVNESDQVVQSAAVLFETCGGTGSAVVGELRPGASQRVHYSVCGEGGYVLEATVEDGRKVRGNEGYVEVGYVSTDRISSQRITSTQSIYGHAL